MKQLVLRLEDGEAAQYKSRLALDRVTMQQHLQWSIRAYLSGVTSATLFAPPDVQAAADLTQHLDNGLSGLKAEAALLPPQDLGDVVRLLDSHGVDTKGFTAPSLEDILEVFADRGIDITNAGGE